MLIGCFDDADGMGTAEWRSAKSPAYFKRGDYVPGLKVRFESLQCSYVSLGRVVDESIIRRNSQDFIFVMTESYVVCFYCVWGV